MKSERTVVAETIERTSSRDPANQNAILTLVQKRAGLLPVPWRREVSNPVLHDFDFLWNSALER